MQTKNKNRSKFRYDEDIVISDINEIYERDRHVPEFFELLQPEDEYVDERYNQIQEPSDLCVMTNVKKYPECIMQAIYKSSKRVLMGTFTQISSHYCIIDKALYVWPFEDYDNVKVIDFNDFICCVASGNINSNVHIPKPDETVFVKKVTNIITVATSSELTIFPCVGQKVYDEYEGSQIKTKLSFRPTSIAISDSGRIYLGSSKGNAYLFRCKLCKIKVGKCEARQYDRTTNGLQKLLPSFIGESFLTVPFSKGSIVQISVCQFTEEVDYITLLTDRSCLHFFAVDSNKIYKLSTFEAENVTFCKVISVPMTESRYIRFIAFTRDGSRFFFGPINSFLPPKSQQIVHLQIRKGPSCFEGQELIDAHYSLSYTIFMFRTFIAITRFSCSPHIAIMNPPEDIMIINLNSSKSLSFERNFNTFNNEYINQHKLSLFNNEFLWQYIMKPSPGYLMTNEGVFKLTFSSPVECLIRIFHKSQGNYALDVHKWINEYNKNDESLAAIILMAIKSPEREHNQSLSLLIQCSNQKETELMSRPPSSNAFLLVTSRLLFPIFHSPIFQKTFEKFHVHPLYYELPQNFLSQIISLNELIKKYLQKINAETQNNVQKPKNSRESNKYLGMLNNFIKIIIEALKFIEIIKQQSKSIITEAFKDFPKEYFDRLLSQTFISSDLHSLIMALREFAVMLFKCPNGPKRDDNFAKQLHRECPTFFSEKDSKIIEALEELRKLKNPPDKTKLENICNIIINNISEYVKLDEICQRLKKFEYYKGIFDISLEKARVVDPMLHAIRWYKEKINKKGDDDDDTGKNEYYKRRECYDYVFDILDERDVFEEMIKSNDELFHLCLYREVFPMNSNSKYKNSHKYSRLRKMLLQTNSDLENYLKENAPQYLWKYYFQHKEYAIAASQLLLYIKNEKIMTITKRIKLLNKDVAIARGTGMSTLLKEAQILLQTAESQIDYMKRKEIGLNDNVMIDSPQKLFDCCCENGYWDIVLRILSFYPIAKVDKTNVVSSVWTNLLVEQFSELKLDAIQQIIVGMADNIGINNNVMDLYILVPILETHQRNAERRGKKPIKQRLWALETLLMCGFSASKLFDVYYKAINDEKLDNEIRCDLIYCLSKLIEQNGNTKKLDMSNIVNWFNNNAADLEYFDEVCNVIDP
ncbi:nuclear pore complex protein [Histomonas meleagridis]|uniref:nuclear pore complex protein n=1 Tax=Histomonas meleagridis TaxID=135588 RepID=UPI003559B3C2|nr:nuclear pore complex protein [Histomonas meleagridis]KAH0799331.1 nuclear pore complex protein [Histomonas meleagridis]